MKEIQKADAGYILSSLGISSAVSPSILILTRDPIFVKSSFPYLYAVQVVVKKSHYYESGLPISCH